MRIKIITLALLMLLSTASSAALVKQSASGICHDQHSAYYQRTQHFAAYETMEQCLQNGGRLPANYKKPTTSANAYNRRSFQHWIDENKNCLNTRHELLKSQSTGPVTMDSKGCRVVRGRWNDPYTGKIFYDGHKVDVDHLVPLKWAWENGANRWTRKKRRTFANDERNLFIVSASANRSKGAKGPAEWLPSNKRFHCQYVTRYLRVLILYQFPQNVRTDVKSIKNDLC